MRIYFFLVRVPDNLVSVVISFDHYSHPVYVPIRDQAILSAHVPNKYWGVYNNIS